MFQTIKTFCFARFTTFYHFSCKSILHVFVNKISIYKNIHYTFFKVSYIYANKFYFIEKLNYKHVFGFPILKSLRSLLRTRNFVCFQSFCHVLLLYISFFSWWESSIYIYIYRSVGYHHHNSARYHRKCIGFANWFY